MSDHSQLDFKLTEAMKRVGLRAGYRAREQIAPRAKTFKECTLVQKEKILCLLTTGTDDKTGNN